MKNISRPRRISFPNKYQFPRTVWNCVLEGVFKNLKNKLFKMNIFYDSSYFLYVNVKNSL